MKIQKLSNGHINESFLFKSSSGKVVIQKLNRSFEQIPDIKKITEFLQDKFPTIEILKDWRVVNYIEGKTFIHPNEKQFESAIRLVCKFHNIIQNFDASIRQDIHAIPELKSEYTKLPNLPLRIIHGDMKFDNILFKGNEAIALIDLDTVHKNTILWDIANMIFMWCGGIRGMPNFEKIKIIEQIYFENVNFIRKKERKYLNRFVELFALEIYYRFKDYKYFEKLSENYCNVRSQNALKFYESFNKRSI